MCHLQKALDLSLNFQPDLLCRKEKLDELEWTLEEHPL